MWWWEYCFTSRLFWKSNYENAKWNSICSLESLHAWITTTPSENIVIASDDLTYSKYIVYVIMKSVIENLLAKHLEIKMINIFSDGARSQFKQKVYTLQLATMGICFKYKAYMALFCNFPSKGSCGWIRRVY